MNRIKSYSGYVNSKSGKKIAFAITINNFNGSSSQATAKIEQILNALAVYWGNSIDMISQLDPFGYLDLGLGDLLFNENLGNQKMTKNQSL